MSWIFLSCKTKVFLTRTHKKTSILRKMYVFLKSIVSLSIFLITKRKCKK